MMLGERIASQSEVIRAAVSSQACAEHAFGVRIVRWTLSVPISETVERLDYPDIGD